MEGRTDGWMVGWMSGWVDVCMYEWMDGRMNGCRTRLLTDGGKGGCIHCEIFV